MPTGDSNEKQADSLKEPGKFRKWQNQISSGAEN